MVLFPEKTNTLQLKKHMSQPIKRLLKSSGKGIGKTIHGLLKHESITNIYNGVFERAPQLLVKAFVRFVGLPDRDLLWNIRLNNGKEVKTKVYRNNAKTGQFALSYRWHSPSLNFTEKLLSDHTAKTHSWIDVGANLGIRSLLALSEQRPVYMLEPNKELNDLNRERCDLNGFKNFEIMETGVSDKKGVAEFYIDESSYNSSLHVGILETNVLNRKETISLDSLDNLFGDLNEAPACIKIDVEGHEIQVIEGANNLIEKWHPPMIVEVNTNSNNYTAFKDQMKRFGYSLYQIHSYESGIYFDRIDMSRSASGDRIDSNDFLAVKDETLEKKVSQYTK